MLPQRLQSCLPAIVSALLAFALYAVTIGGTYIYDDVAVVRPEHDSRLADPSQWWRYWTESYNQGVDNLYRPLVSMSFALEWWLHGDRAWIFHLINVLLHAGVSAGVAEFARRALNTRAAFAAGLLFAAHPLHVEDVANIVGRAELMCALGMIGALILLLRPMTGRRAVAIAACFVLAVLSKEQGMLIPLFLLILGALIRLFRQPRTADPANAPQITPDRADQPRVLDYATTSARRRLSQGTLLLIVLLCWLLAGYIVWRESILKFWWDRNFIDWTINPMVNSEWHPYGGTVGRDRILMPLALLGRYTQLLIFPLKLSPDYGAKVIGWSVAPNDPYLWLGVAAVLGWLIVLILSLRARSAACTFAALALPLSYGMIANLAAFIGTNFAERLMYMPSLFFILLAAAGLARLPWRMFLALTTIILGLASLRTVTYAARWNDALTFYERSLAEQPKSIRLYMLLASEYAERGRMAEAERTVREGTELLPEYWEIWVHRGDIAMRQGKWDQAQRYFDTAMNIRPSMKIQSFMEALDRRRKAAEAATRATATAPATTQTSPN